MNKREHRNIISRIAKIREAANSFIEQELKARGILGIVPAHGTVLAFLFQQEEPVPITSLVKKTGRVKSTVSGIVKTLERHEYVFRQTCPDDARSSQIGLTAKGRAIRSDFEDISNQLLERAYGDMPMEDRDRLAALLAKVNQNIVR